MVKKKFQYIVVSMYEKVPINVEPTWIQVGWLGELGDTKLRLNIQFLFFIVKIQHDNFCFILTLNKIFFNHNDNIMKRGYS